MDIKQNENENIYHKKECLFSFSKINKYFLIPFLCPILSSIIDIFILKIENLNEEEKDKENQENEEEMKIKKYEFLITLLLSFSYILGGLLYFFDILRMRTHTTKNKALTYYKTESSIKLIYNNNYDDLIAQKSDTKVIIILFLMPILLSIILFIQEFSFSEKIFEQNIFYLIFIPLFSRYILKEKLYKHQKVSLIISIISGFSLIIIPDICLLYKYYLINIFELFSSIIYCLEIVLIKLLTNKYYISPYKVLLFIGIGSLILIIICNIIYSLIVERDLSLILKDFDFFGDLKYLFYIIIILILDFFYETLRCLVIYYFSPNLLMITDIIYPIINLITNFIKEKNLSIINIIKFIGFFIIFIFVLIYNEIIICNFCDLNKNTKKYIFERQKLELISLEQDEDTYGNEEDN